MWAATFAARHPNVAVLDLSSFKCGHDAPTYGLVDTILQTSKTPVAALHDIDANKPGGSIKIRVKTYAHSLRLHQERLEDLSERRRELERAVDEKRLQLLELKQRQLDAMKRSGSGAGRRDRRADREGPRLLVAPDAARATRRTSSASERSRTGGSFPSTPPLSAIPAE